MKYNINSSRAEKISVGNIFWGLIGIAIVIELGIFLFRPDIIIMGL